ncbi:N-6 DNA methylase, partial [Porphyromonas uenonis]|uniref:N-6 DNA methylase n=1 Tax=Porphyromonas uenonis TaxID=281920 RepID=UPI0026EBC658
SKHKADDTIQFIDASGEEFYKKETNNNILTEEHIAHIMQIFADKEPVPYVATSVPYAEIVENDYNLSVTSYVEPEDQTEVIDIDDLQGEIAETVARINELRSDIDAIVEEIGGE